jgi:hypothetical protein
MHEWLVGLYILLCWQVTINLVPTEDLSHNGQLFELSREWLVALWDCVHYAGTSPLSSNSVMRLCWHTYLCNFVSTKYKPTIFLSSLIKTIDKISWTMMMWVSYTSIFTDEVFLCPLSAFLSLIVYDLSLLCIWTSTHLISWRFI